MKNLTIIFIFLIMVSCSSNGKKDEVSSQANELDVIQLNADQMTNLGIKTDYIKQDSISSVLKVNGKIDVPPQNMVSVSIPLGGYLKSTQLLPGMKVTKGEIIATIEDQQYIQLQQEYLAVKVKTLYAENEYKRQKELNASKASSDKVFQMAETEYTTQKIALKSLDEKLKLINVVPEQLNETNISRTINVYAPISGFVSKINVNIGKYVNPADVVFELVNPSDIHLALTIFEKDIDQLSIGQKLTAFTNNNPDKKYECEILLIGQNLNAERSIEVHCHFKNYDNALIPGMYMNAELQVNSKKADVMAEEAVVNYAGKEYVFVEKENNIYALTQVDCGNSENGKIIINNAMALKGKAIVVKGAYALLMALKNKQGE